MRLSALALPEERILQVSTRTIALDLPIEAPEADRPMQGREDRRPLLRPLGQRQVLHMSEHKGARLALDALPPALGLIADRGYDSAWFRQQLEPRGIEPCIRRTKTLVIGVSVKTLVISCGWYM